MLAPQFDSRYRKKGEETRIQNIFGMVGKITHRIMADKHAEACQRRVAPAAGLGGEPGVSYV